MSAADIAPLEGMGASRTQAIKALAKHKEVMEAAEAIFADEFDDENGEEHDQDEVWDFGEEDGETYYDDIDILSESDEQVDFDPYKGIDMSKERTKTVIELEQISNRVTIELKGKNHTTSQMTQGQWMQGCPEGSEQSANSLIRQLDKWIQEDDGKVNCGDGAQLMSGAYSVPNIDTPGTSQTKLAKDVAAIKAHLCQQQKHQNV